MNNRIQHGSGVFECRNCGRTTRDTTGDNGAVLLCEDCYEGCSWENEYLNASTDAESDAAKTKMLAAFERARAKGGKPGQIVEREPEKPAPHFLWIYLCDRAYGGPEEGGWWYDCGEPVLPGHWAWEELWHFCALMPSNQAASEARDRIQKTLDATVNQGRVSVDELMSEGVFRAMVSQEAPAPFPATIPRYE